MTFFPRCDRSAIQRLWGCALALLIAFASVCRGDDRQTIEELKVRIEAVERQNQQLIDQLKRQQYATKSPVGTVQQAAYEPEKDAEVDAVFSQTTDNQHIRSVIKEYLDEQEAKRKLAEQAKKAEAEEAGYEVGSDLGLNSIWKYGLDFESKNKDFRVHVGGRTQIDTTWFAADEAVQSGPGGVGPINDGVNFRRARLGVSGTMYETIDWIAEFDFVNSALVNNNPVNLPAPTDVFWTFTKLPYVGNLRVGNVKEPIGFEHLVSSRYLSFRERSFNQDAFNGPFNNGFIPGAMMFNAICDERMTWYAGVFKPTTNVFANNVGGGEYSLTGRVTALPWYVDEGRGLLHLGASLRQAGMDDGIVRFRARGPLRAGPSASQPVYANTGNINGSGQQMVNAELAAVVGPWTFQSEWLVAFVQEAFQTGKPEVGTLFYQGGYAEVLYFFSGEHRAYNRQTGIFDRVVPHENFFLVRGDEGSLFGRGAWQVGARYSFLDLNDKGINGGILNDMTLGLNWFLNPNMKLQWNYTLTYRDSPTPASSGFIQGFGMRLAHDF